MSKRCHNVFSPIVDQSRVVTLAVETTGPLLNTDVCQCGNDRCRRNRRRKHRR
jgi:hypothetical protein